MKSIIFFEWFHFWNAGSLINFLYILMSQPRILVYWINPQNNKISQNTLHIILVVIDLGGYSGRAWQILAHTSLSLSLTHTLSRKLVVCFT
jgi:hypothetical protein